VTKSNIDSVWVTLLFFVHLFTTASVSVEWDDNFYLYLLPVNSPCYKSSFTNVVTRGSMGLHPAVCSTPVKFKLDKL